MDKHGRVSGNREKACKMPGSPMRYRHGTRQDDRTNRRRRLFFDLLSEIGKETDAREIYELLSDAVPFVLGAGAAGTPTPDLGGLRTTGGETGPPERDESPVKQSHVPLGYGAAGARGDLPVNGGFESPERLYRSIVEISSALTNAERVSLMLPEEGRGHLLVKSVKGIDAREAKKIRVPVGSGIAGKVYQEGRPLLVKDMEKDLSLRKKPNYRTGSFVSMPLRIGGELLGVLNLADRRDGRTFSEDDITFLTNIAFCASVTIRGAQCCSKFEEMRTLSITDSLTGLFNRRYFDERLCEELHRASRYDTFFSLAIFDIDNFKLFNDTEGHLAGDEVLKAVKDISRESLRSIDVIARFGGEEFAIIMPQTEKDEAFLVAERVRRNIRKAMSGRWANFPQKDLTVSIGIASFPSDGKDSNALIKNADKALYKAKISGKNKTVVWDRD